MPPVPAQPAGPLLSCREVSKAYGAQVLFTGVSFHVFDGDRVGVIGPNGAGKSTLLRLLAGLEPPDEGACAVRKGTRVAFVPQESEFPPDATVEEVLRAAAAGGEIAEVCGRAGFVDRAQRAGTLSGGWRRRLAIARELVRAPDVLLLDEPTNHLDLEGLAWLEDLLLRAPFATVSVSHDRWFLQSVATRVVELDRTWPGGTLSCEGSYADFVERRDERAQELRATQEVLQNKVRREVEWLRRGPKARATKAQYRRDEAARLMAELADVTDRNTRGGARFDFTGTERRTRRLLTAIGVAKSMGGRELFRDLSLTLSPGMRLGLVGGNGSGKTTLLRVLSGELFPDAGRVETAPALGVVRFDQQREQLDGRVRLRRALSPDGDQVTYRGQAMHVSGWARRFGFRVDQLDTPVADLSGGEQARVLIARLVVRPADLLLLDEPTNDLDIPTLEVLEESLLDFPGAVVIVTHDRYLMDRVANVLVGLDGLGASQFVADLAQWGEVRSAAAARPSDSSPAGRGGINAAARGRAAAAAPQAKPLTYAEELELRGMDDAISSAEASAGDRRRALEDPAIASDPARLLERHAEAEAARAEVDRLYARWEWLEAKRQA